LSSSDDTATATEPTPGEGTDTEGTDTPEAEAEPTPEPDELREGLLATLSSELGDALVDSLIKPGDDIWVRVSRDAWQQAGLAVRDKLGCKHFTFLSAIDWLPSPYGRYQDAEVDKAVHGDEAKELPAQQSGYAGGDTRFQVFARVADIDRNRYFGITLKADLPDDDLTIDTWRTIYAGADWHEREAWEMYGITFNGHPYLRHLYLPGDFEGHPLRKDYPLLARVVKPWPGIVDVEPMPGEDEAEGEGTEGEAAEAGDAEAGDGA
jgi:NADH-quinone oxidoreductase subunit C